MGWRRGAEGLGVCPRVHARARVRRGGGRDAALRVGDGGGPRAAGGAAADPHADSPADGAHCSPTTRTPPHSPLGLSPVLRFALCRGGRGLLRARPPRSRKGADGAASPRDPAIAPVRPAAQVADSVPPGGPGRTGPRHLGGGGGGVRVAGGLKHTHAHPAPAPAPRKCCPQQQTKISARGESTDASAALLCLSPGAAGRLRTRCRGWLSSRTRPSPGQCGHGRCACPPTLLSAAAPAG